MSNGLELYLALTARERRSEIISVAQCATDRALRHPTVLRAIDRSGAVFDAIMPLLEERPWKPDDLQIINDNLQLLVTVRS